MFSLSLYCSTFVEVWICHLSFLYFILKNSDLYVFRFLLNVTKVVDLIDFVVDFTNWFYFIPFQSGRQGQGDSIFILR